MASSLLTVIRALSIGLVLVLTVSGCTVFGAEPGATTVDSELAGTRWSGVDSDGASWGIDFQADGTVGLAYQGDRFDDGGDVWSELDGTVTIRLGFDDGEVRVVGRYLGADDPLETTGSYEGGTFALTLERD